MRLRVSDTGVGMTARSRARAFEPFFTTKPKGQGTGLGLATVYGIVTQAGGTCRSTPSPGLGTTVTVLLPVDRRARARARRRARREPDAGRRRDGPGRRGRAGDARGHAADPDAQRLRVLAARRRREAIELAGEHPGAIDLLLTDVVMPEMLGKEVAERVAARCARTSACCSCPATRNP